MVLPFCLPRASCILVPSARGNQRPQQHSPTCTPASFLERPLPLFLLSCPPARRTGVFWISCRWCPILGSTIFPSSLPPTLFLKQLYHPQNPPRSVSHPSTLHPALPLRSRSRHLLQPAYRRMLTPVCSAPPSGNLFHLPQQQQTMTAVPLVQPLDLTRFSLPYELSANSTERGTTVSQTYGRPVSERAAASPTSSDSLVSLPPSASAHQTTFPSSIYPPPPPSTASTFSPNLQVITPPDSNVLKTASARGSNSPSSWFDSAHKPSSLPASNNGSFPVREFSFPQFPYTPFSSSYSSYRTPSFQEDIQPPAYQYPYYPSYPTSMPPTAQQQADARHARELAKARRHVW